uniref:Uncharacterized protein n=1 Tax=Arundo donax TaxID=35708 RepID=A0A0A8XWW9_ARUDO
MSNSAFALGCTCICDPAQGQVGSVFFSHNHRMRRAQLRVGRS